DADDRDRRAGRARCRLSRDPTLGAGARGRPSDRRADKVRRARLPRGPCRTPHMSASDGFETRAIHAGQQPDPHTGAVVPPITLASTFAQEAVGKHKGYEYARSGNPTRT